MGQSDCIFCRIADGDIEAKLVREDEETVAFRDLNPQAPTHVLVIPRRHIQGVSALTAGDAGIIGKLFLAAKEIARDDGVEAGGYRLVVNTGADAGQSVDHIHVHVIGGRKLGWPPG